MNTVADWSNIIISVPLLIWYNNSQKCNAIPYKSGKMRSIKYKRNSHSERNSWFLNHSYFANCSFLLANNEMLNCDRTRICNNIFFQTKISFLRNATAITNREKNQCEKANNRKKEDHSTHIQRLFMTFCANSRYLSNVFYHIVLAV